MATSKQSRPSSSSNSKPRRRSAARPAQVELGAEELKRLAKAPGDYQGIARKFADALASTKFRAPVSAHKLRSMVARGERLAQRAQAAQIKATAADRRRMVQDSQAWKGLLASWRLVQAAMPERPELEAPFAFMQEYMSVSRSTPPTQAAPMPAT